MGKYIICVGLDGDADQQPIGQVLQLICLSPSQPMRIPAECMRCNSEYGIPSKAWYSIRLPTAPPRAGTFDTGGAEKYEAVCLKHLQQHHSC